MTAFGDKMTGSVQAVLDMAWDIREGTVVPDTASVKLSGGAVRVTATYLYADLAGSSHAAHKLKKEVTGKIVRSYLDAASRVIRHHDGEIRSFDGDRVMGIFIGGSKNTNSIKAGLGIHWAVANVIGPKLAAMWPTLKDYWSIAHGVGIATGEAFIVRGGVRDNNDLVSIGEAPNVAAKLSGLRGWPNVYVTHDVYDNCADEAKFTDGKSMWTECTAQTVGGTTYRVKGSTWCWEP